MQPIVKSIRTFNPRCRIPSSRLERAMICTRRCCTCIGILLSTKALSQHVKSSVGTSGVKYSYLRFRFLFPSLPFVCMFSRSRFFSSHSYNKGGVFELILTESKFPLSETELYPRIQPTNRSLSFLFLVFLTQHNKTQHNTPSPERQENIPNLVLSATLRSPFRPPVESVARLLEGCASTVDLALDTVSQHVSEF